MQPPNLSRRHMDRGRRQPLKLGDREFLRPPNLAPSRRRSWAIHIRTRGPYLLGLEGREDHHRQPPKLGGREYPHLPILEAIGANIHTPSMAPHPKGL